LLTHPCNISHRGCSEFRCLLANRIEFGPSGLGLFLELSSLLLDILRLSDGIISNLLRIFAEF
jgi:hypothetical protein